MNLIKVEHPSEQTEPQQLPLQAIEDAQPASSSKPDKRKVTFAAEVKHASTETPLAVSLGEIWTQAMEDGTQTIQSQNTREVFTFGHRVHPNTRRGVIGVCAETSKPREQEATRWPPNTVDCCLVVCLC